MWEKAGWESGAVVADTNLDALGSGPLDADSDRRGAMLGGVIDEVADDPIQVVGVCTDVLGCGAVDVELVAEAVAVAVAEKENRDRAAPMIVLSTAHPAKFAEIVEPIIGRPVDKPAALAAALNGPQHIIRIRASLDRVLGMLDG